MDSAAENVRPRLAADLPPQRRPAGARRRTHPRDREMTDNTLPKVTHLTRTEERILMSDIFERDAKVPRQDLGTVREPAQDVKVYRQCDVLVVGGGPSGTAAA